MDFQLSNLALKHLIEEMQILKNGFVNNVQTLENNWIKLKVHTKEGDKTIVITPNAFFISNKALQAKQSPGGFSAFMKKHIYNQRIISIKQSGLDRIVIFEFQQIFLVLELFAKGNIIICNKEMQIIRSMRKEEWKDRKLSEGEEYKFPSSKGKNPLEEKEKDFLDALKKNEKTFFGACIDLLNISPQILEFIFDKNRLDKRKNASTAEKKEAEKVLLEAKEIYSRKENGCFLIEKVLYTTDIKKPAEKEYENINSALNALSFEENTEVIIEKEKAVSKKSKGIESKKKMVEGFLVQEKELQEKGEAIYLHYAEINELLAAIKKAKEKGLSEKEIEKKINSVKNCIKTLDLKKGKVVYKND